jgi:hypothetical protein
MDVGLPYIGTEGPLSIQITVAGEATSLPAPQDCNVALLGDVYEGNASNTQDTAISFSLNADVMEYNFSYTLTNSTRNFISRPYIAMQLESSYDSIEEIVLAGNVDSGGSIAVNAEVGDADTMASIEFISPITSIVESSIDNLTIPAEVNMASGVYSIAGTANAVSLSAPVSLVALTEIGSISSAILSASVTNIDVLLSADVFNEDSLQYKVADIDHGMVTGSIRIFPNDWTLCYINKPKNEDGSDATISSTLVSMLSEKYGSDIHTKISMIVAKHPLTGEVYNYVIRDGYQTPAGSVNDFKICYMRDDVYYPIPFMVQSISGDELSIEWDV